MVFRTLLIFMASILVIYSSGLIWDYENHILIRNLENNLVLQSAKNRLRSIQLEVDTLRQNALTLNNDITQLQNLVSEGQASFWRRTFYIFSITVSSSVLYCLISVIWTYVQAQIAQLNPYGRNYHILHAYIIPLLRNVILQIITATTIFMVFTLLFGQFEMYLMSYVLDDVHTLRGLEDQLVVIKARQNTLDLETAHVENSARNFERTVGASSGHFGYFTRVLSYTLVVGLSLSLFCCGAWCFNG